MNKKQDKNVSSNSHGSNGKIQLPHEMFVDDTLQMQLENVFDQAEEDGGPKSGDINKIYEISKHEDDGVES